MVKAQILLLLEYFLIPMVCVFFHCLIFSFSANKFRMPNVKKETGDFRFLHVYAKLTAEKVQSDASKLNDFTKARFTY